MTIKREYYIDQFRIYEHDNASSTMILAQDAQPFDVIRAYCQTKGHGRSNRKWHDEGDGDGISTCLFSVVMPIPQEKMHMNLITIIGITVVESIKKIQLQNNLQNVANISLKWPNDIVINGKKAGGVIIELSSDRSGIVIIGIGLNISYHPDKCNSILEATCLHNEGFSSINGNDMLGIILPNLKQDIETWLTHGFISFKSRLDTIIFSIGSNTIIKDNNESPIVQGTFIAINNEGCAVIKEYETGNIVTVSHGDLFISD